MFFNGINWLCLMFYLSTITFGLAIYCDHRKHEFYLSQGNFCKKCDRCPPGSGLDLLEKIKVHEEHGALECRKCILCPEGYFSKSWSYRECKRCRNCTVEGKLELHKCSSTFNAKCGQAIHVTVKTTSTESVSDKSEQYVTHKTSDNTTEIIIILTAVVSLTLFALAVIGIVFIKYSKIISNGGSTSNYEKTPCIDGV